MTPDRWQRVKDVLCAALEQDPQSREYWLQHACAGDESLHREVHSLIVAYDGPPGFLDVPAIEHAHLASPAPADWIGRIVGRYRILEEIGRGGMSAVFRASRLEEQFEHEVAIKLLHRSHDPDVLMRRFRAERQMLARLSHPNIAHLLDGASTGDGVPYLIMEYVRGEPVDAYCERRRLSLVARLRLFRTLCDAVHHVHRHLMVHGDIKCSNVLVNEDGIVKLLDFGIARLLDAENGSAWHAHTCTIALTPESASPEQIRGEPLTTASDVYSLGILLHRLLSGQPAYETDSDAYYELTRHICEHPPRRPSLALKGTTAPYSPAQLRGDLDNIVLKALHKDPERRYGSVEQLSQDVAWYLGGFPIAAAPESRSYRLRKFVGRNRALATAGSLLAISLVVGIVATSWQAHRADLERQRAQRHFDDVRTLAQTFMLDVHDSITPLPGTLPVRGKIIGHSLRYLDALAQENAADPQVRRDLARAYERVGDMQSDFLASNLQNNEAAIISYRKALDLRESLRTHEPGDDGLLRERLQQILRVAQISQSNRAMDDAARYSLEAVEVARMLMRKANPSAEDIRLSATTGVVRGTIQAMTGSLAEGLEAIGGSIRMYEQQIRNGDTRVKVRRNLATAYGRRGNLAAKIGGRYDTAYDAQMQALRIYESLLLENPRDNELRKEAAFALMDAGEAAARTGRSQEGLDKRQQAVDRLRSLTESDPQREELRFTLAWAMGDLASSFTEQDRHADAVRHLEEAQKLLGGLSGAEATRLNTTQFLMAMNDLKLGQLRMSQADAAQASRDRRETLWREARTLVQRSAQVFGAAKSDAVLAPEALEHLRTAEAALGACDQALQGLHRSS
jgi:eukaryotic-like serine/threonine-protein kinase